MRKIINKIFTSARNPRLGPELIINGGFTTDTDWSKNGNWTIGSGVASTTTDTNSLAQGNVFTVGKVYQVRYDVVSVSAGSVVAKIGQTVLTTRNAPGTYTEIGVCSVDTLLRIQAESNFTGSIDNVSAREVLQRG